MPSNIDFTKPIYGTPTTQSVRDNFEIAQVEITNLQDIIAEGPFVPVEGGTMTGPLELSQDPLLNVHAATKRYVDNIAFGGGSGGAPEAPKTGMFFSRGGGSASVLNDWSNNPLFTGLRIGSDKDTLLFGLRSDVSYNFYDFAMGGNDFLRYNRGTKVLELNLNGALIVNFSDTAVVMNKSLTLSADPTTAMHAVTKQYVDAKPGGALITDTLPASAPGTLAWSSIDGQLYVRYDDGNTQQWVAASNMAGLANAATTMDVDKALGNVGRNLIHNGLFTVAQRGAGPFTGTNYAVDRWVTSATLGTMTTTQIALADADRAAIGDESAKYAMQMVCAGAAGATDSEQFNQTIEDVRRLGGKTVIVSFWAKATAGTPKVALEMFQGFGGGGSPSAAVVAIGSQAFTLSTTWTRYVSTPIAIPSVAGKTLGTDNKDGAGVVFWLSAGSNYTARSSGIGQQSYTLQLWGIQLEIVQPGQTVPSKLEKRDPVLELQQCQRFFQTGQVWIGASATAGNLIGTSATFPVTMRATPIMVLTNSASSNIGTVNNYPNSASVIVTASATASAATVLSQTFTASADL